MISKPEIFFSYAWGNDSEQGQKREAIVNELYNELVGEGHQVIRDRNNVRYRNLFS